MNPTQLAAEACSEWGNASPRLQAIIQSAIEKAMESLRNENVNLLRSLNAAQGEIIEMKAARQLASRAAHASEQAIEQQKAVAMTRTCLWRLREERKSIEDAKGKDAVPAYLKRCIDHLSVFEGAAHASVPTCDEKYAKLIESRAHASEPNMKTAICPFCHGSFVVEAKHIMELAHASEQGADTKRLLLRIRKFIEPRTECAQDSDEAKRLVKAINAAMSQRK